MSTHGLTSDVIKQRYPENVINESRTYETLGVGQGEAEHYLLHTREGNIFLQSLIDADPSAQPDDVQRRAVEQLRSGRDLPRMETIRPGEGLVKFVAEGQPLSAHSPYWAREVPADAALAAGSNISDYYGLPVGSEAQRYDMYRMTPKVPTQVFISTVAPTSELDALVTKQGGAEQALVPNRGMFNRPVRLRAVDNIPALATGRGVASDLARGTGVLGAATVAYDAATSAARTSDLLQQGNKVGAASAIEHFGSRNLGMLGGAALGAELAGAAGIESGPFDLLVAGAGGIAGAVGGDKLANAYDRHQIYNQDDPQGVTWHYDPAHPQQGWTREVATGWIDRAWGKGRTEMAPPAVAERLTFQANTTAVELALAHPAAPREPYTQPANAHDAASFGNPPWQRDPHTGTWQRQIRFDFVERGMTPPFHTETASPPRAAQLDAAAARTIANNVATSNPGIAQRYAEAYRQRGWAQYGAMPAAVTRALTHASTTRAAPAAAAHADIPRGFNDPAHPQHAMYVHLKGLLPPGTSAARLAQATAACHCGGMDHPADLETIHGGDTSLIFYPCSLFAQMTAMELSQPAPSVQQSLQQVQAFDQQRQQGRSRRQVDLQPQTLSHGPRL